MVIVSRVGHDDARLPRFKVPQDITRYARYLIDRVGNFADIQHNMTVG